MLLGEALKTLKNNGFLLETTNKFNYKKIIKQLNKIIPDWQFEELDDDDDLDNILASKQINDTSAEIGIDIYPKSNTKYAIHLFTYKSGVELPRFQDDWNSLEYNEMIDKIEEYVNDVEMALNFLKDNDIDYKQKNVNNKLTYLSGFYTLKNEYEGKTVNKKIYALCKKYATTVKSISWVPGFIFNRKRDDKKEGWKKIDLGHKAFIFELRRKHTDDEGHVWLRGAAISRTGLREAVVVPETQEVYFNTYDRYNDRCFTEGPRKFENIEELKKILEWA